MGKQGPCFHCGVASTPLWRNGPPEKPVLCNACGSRWRTKGSLENYTPLHARAESDDCKEYKVPKVKNLIIKTKEAKLYKRKQNDESLVIKRECLDYEQNFRRSIDEDTSNRSSSGSAISYSESCAQFGSTDGTEMTGSSQSIVWDSVVPSKRRTCVGRPKTSSVEKLTKDLHSILNEQQQSSYFSGSAEEDLLFGDETPMVSVEIGHGSILMKHPSSAVRDEESEASSFSTDNRSYITNEVYSGSTSLHVHSNNRGFNSPSVGNEKRRIPSRPEVQQDCTKGEKVIHKEKSQILQNHNSPLRSTDLKDVVSFEEFVRHFTLEEQQLLMKHLPSVDTAVLPNSLKSLFGSSQFAENLSSFQQLLAEGVFDLTFSVTNMEDCRTLKTLALANPLKSKWVEHYNLLKDAKAEEVIRGKGVATGSSVLRSHNFLLGKRPRDPHNQNFPEPKAKMRSPKKLIKKAGYETKDPIDNDDSCFSPRSLFAFTPERSSLMLDSFQFTDDNSDQDLLLDLPPNGSFPQAELLHPPSSLSSHQTNSSSSVICSYLTNY